MKKHLWAEAAKRQVSYIGFMLLIWGAASCGNFQHGPVTIDLTKLGGIPRGESLSAHQAFVSADRVAAIPKSVQAVIGQRIADPAGAFNPSDVRVRDGIANRRLVFVGLSEGYCLIHYEYGGIAHGYLVALFKLSGNDALPIWAHAGGKYRGLEQFAAESDPDELTNDVRSIIW